MSLLAYNKRTTVTTTAAGSPPVALPVSALDGTRGPGVNVTSELKGLSGGNYVSLEAQRTAGDIDFVWQGEAEYSTPGLTVEAVENAGAAAAAQAAAIATAATDATTKANAAQAAAIAAAATDATTKANAAAAAAEAYTPAVTGNWTGADPTTVAQALDRIAAALGPIA